VSLRRRSIRRDEELARLELDGREIDYVLKRSSARRSLSLKVNRQGLAQINAPWSMPLYRIEQFLRGHDRWLQEQLRKRESALVWGDGLRLPYLGAELRLVWQPSANLSSIRASRGVLHCLSPEADLETLVVGWYRERAAEVLSARLGMVCAGLGREPPPWRLSNASTRWGSLSAKGVVGLSWRLVKAAPELIDYVICHELAHFRRRDHSAAFWREVERLCPGFETLRNRLRRDGARYLEF
jgi:predicted metal-dependent hydrolase